MNTIKNKDIPSFIPPIEHKQKNVLPGVRVYLEKCDHVIRRFMEEDYLPTDIHKLRSRMIDVLVLNLYTCFITELGADEKNVRQNLTLIATGGYGREEMAILSDIDLLFVVSCEETSFCEQLAKKILYVLWDLKFDVGHAVRSFEESISYLKEEHTIFTAFIDARLLVGDESVYQKIIEERDSYLQEEGVQKKMFFAKLKEREERLKKYGDTVYLLEPHIKEGDGGLRDLQLLRWMTHIIGLQNGYEGLQKAGFIDKQVCVELTAALNYYLRLRNKLHSLLHRKSDQIDFNTQILIAKDLGYRDDETSLGVEKFMRSFYSVATQVNQNVRALLQKSASHLGVRLREPKYQSKNCKLDDCFQVVDDQVMHSNPDLLQSDLTRVMTLFKHVQQTGLDVHFSTRDLLLAELPRIDDYFRKNKKVCLAFSEMMTDYTNLGKTLFAMHDVHFFDALIPEFKDIRNRMQHNVYHVYTVDTHSIYAVNQLSQLMTAETYQKDFSLYYQAVLSIKRKDLLSLGLLFHDVGKGRGGDHSVVGAEVADHIMTRLGYNEADREVVEFLVRSHLIMPHLSQRRDLQDRHMITEFAKSVENIEKLNMLFVLTWSDIRAVNAEAWTEWKDQLLQMLYKKTADVLTGEESTEEIVRKKVADVHQSILGRLQSKIERERLEAFLQSISARYVLAHTDEEIDEHFHMITNHDDESLLLLEKEITQGTISEVLIYSISNPRIIPLVTGVMLSLGINILSMENFMLSDGHVLIKIRVQSGNEESLRKANLVERLRKRMFEVFSGKSHVEHLIQKRKPASFMLKKPVQRADTEVNIDNDVSAFYTVIDVLTHDRLGLLYDIVSCLTRQGCYVELSKISTKVEQVVDTLYVKDIFGQKITAKDKLAEIKAVLFEIVN
ncbi:MAG: [protein-PII] uridylyltransferase [bacterium]|nr:[protein-PII] uridylyltransferase [bacterium]MBU1917215.1 [protein-PII] uridylyltransferase [bacterium]